MTALIYKAALPTYTSLAELNANAGESLLLNDAGTAYELEPAQGGASVAPAWVNLSIATGSTPSGSPQAQIFLGASGVPFFLSGGPLTVDAGSWLGLASNERSLADGATLELNNFGCDLCVTNLAGTEKLAVGCNAVVLPEDATVVNIVLNIARLNEQIGTDLSVNGAGRIVSTAGGQFFVQVAGNLIYTTP